MQEASEAQRIASKDFEVDKFLAEIADVFPEGRSYIGSNPSKAAETLNAAFPAQWKALCALTLPPNGFASQPWWNDKAARKAKWVEKGLPSQYLVPTLYHTYISTEHIVPDTGTYEWEEGSDGPSLLFGEARTRHTPLDPQCEEALAAVLRREGRFVLKPIEGNRAEGVQLVCAAAQGASAESEVTVRRHSSEASLVEKGDGERLAWSAWFRSCVVENAQLRTGVVAEPFLEWDNEVTCISVAGGRLVVVGSKGGLVRSGFAAAATRGAHAPVHPLVLVAGRAPLLVTQAGVTDARRDKYQLRCGEEEEGEGRAEALVGQREAGSGRRLSEVISSAVRAVAADVSITRVDFFVGYERRGKEGGGGAWVRLNEVEHGFDAGLLPSWFGQQMTELIAKAWVLLGASPAQRHAFLSSSSSPVASS